MKRKIVKEQTLQSLFKFGMFLFEILQKNNFMLDISERVYLNKGERLDYISIFMWRLKFEESMMGIFYLLQNILQIMNDEKLCCHVSKYKFFGNLLLI